MATVPKQDVIILLPYIGLRSKSKVLCKLTFVFSLLLMSKLFFKAPGASNPSFHTRTVSTDHNYPSSFIKLVAVTAISFTLGKRNEDSTTRKRNISSPFRKVITLLLLLITLKLATGHNIKLDHFDILASGKTDYHCKVKETLFIQELQPALNANASSEKLLRY